MLRPLTWAVLLAVAAAGVAIGEALSFDSTAYFGVLLAVMFAASLTDRDRFYGRDLSKTKPRRRAGARTHS